MLLEIDYSLVCLALLLLLLDTTSSPGLRRGRVEKKRFPRRGGGEVADQTVRSDREIVPLFRPLIRRGKAVASLSNALFFIESDVKLDEKRSKREERETRVKAKRRRERQGSEEAPR